MKHIGGVFDKVARKALSRHGGPVMAELVRAWPHLCPEVADFARPEALKRGGKGPATLKLRVAPARALEVQMMAPQLVERINTHFGQAVVGRVVLVQAPAGDGATTLNPVKKAPAPDSALLARLREGLDNVRDPALRAALERVAEGIARKAARAGCATDMERDGKKGRARG